MKPTLFLLAAGMGSRYGGLKQLDGKNDVGSWPFNKPFYVILNLAWGGDWGGMKGDGAGYVGFTKIADEYSSTDAGNLANLYAGLCYANLGKWQKLRRVWKLSLQKMTR